MNFARQAKDRTFGLTDQQLEQIKAVFYFFPTVQRAVIFGSRAKGTNKLGSDIDIALFGTNLEAIITRISYQLNEELLLPFFFDVIDYASITNKDLKEHIDRVGVVFFQAK